MKRPNSAVAVTVVAHFAYLIYLPSGGFLALRWPRTIWLHVPTVLWGIGVVVFGFPCPLTSLESVARSRAQMRPLSKDGFIDQYVSGVLCPAKGIGWAQALAFSAAGVSWVVLARKRRRPAPRNRASNC